MIAGREKNIPNIYLFIYLLTDSNMSNKSMRNTHGIMAIGGQHRAAI
jgi:hypothetical protein